MLAAGSSKHTNYGQFFISVGAAMGLKQGLGCGLVDNFFHTPEKWPLKQGELGHSIMM